MANSPTKNLFYFLQYELLKLNHYRRVTEQARRIKTGIWEVSTKFHSVFMQVGDTDLSPTITIDGEEYQNFLQLAPGEFSEELGESPTFRYSPLNGLIETSAAIDNTTEVYLTFTKPTYTVIDGYFKYHVDTNLLRSIVPFYVVGFNMNNFNAFELGGGLTRSTMSVTIELVASYGDQIEEMSNILGELLASSGVLEIDLTQEPLTQDPSVGYAFVNLEYDHKVIGGWDVNRVPIRNVSFGYGDLNAYRAVTEIFLS